MVVISWHIIIVGMEVNNSMKFKGDIIITDPGYIVKEERSLKNYPKREDYFSYPEVYQYPDYRIATEEECNELLDDWTRQFVQKHNEKIYISQLYKQEKENYRKAMHEYNENNIDDWDISEYGYHMEKLGFEHCITRSTIYGDWSCTTFDTDTGEPIGEFCADAGMVGVFLLDEVLKYNPDFDYHTARPWTTTLIKGFDGEVKFEVVHTEGVYDEDTPWCKKGEKWEDDEVQVVGKGNINFVGKQTGL